MRNTKKAVSWLNRTALSHFMASAWCREAGGYQRRALCFKQDIAINTQPQIQTNTYWCASQGILLQHHLHCGPIAPLPDSRLRHLHQPPPGCAFPQHLQSPRFSRRGWKGLQQDCKCEGPQSKPQRLLLLPGNSGLRWTLRGERCDVSLPGGQPDLTCPALGSTESSASHQAAASRAV